MAEPHVRLRQAVEKQLSKMENSNKFSKAICVGEEDFLQATKEEMDVAEGCRRLIKSALICWNYLYLSRQIKRERDPEEKRHLIASIQAGSIMTWRHFNLEGYYDFSDEQMKDSFDLEAISTLNLHAILAADQDEPMKHF